MEWSSIVTNPLIATVYAATAAANVPLKQTDGVLGMILNAGPMVKFIMFGLLALSVICWFVIFNKYRLFRRSEKESRQFIDLFKQRKNYVHLYRDSQSLENSHLASIFRAGYSELNRMSKSLETKNIHEIKMNPEILLENVDRAVQGSMMFERERFERLLPFLATTGSTAPFIGLFGTVWGIMTSFQDIGMKGAANLAVVAPGISEALVATAMGLAAAIPAVVGYNYFVNRIRTVDSEMSHFSADFLNMLKRDLMRRGRQDEAE